jgi:hypothetical protein
MIKMFKKMGKYLFLISLVSLIQCWYKAKKKNMCVYGHPIHPIFQPPTLTFFIGNYSTLIFANDPINFYTEFG